MFLRKEILKDRLTLFFDTNTYNRINTKQEEYIQTHKKNPLIYKIRYRQLCLYLDFYLINHFLQKMPAKYQEVLKLRYEQGYTLAKISLQLNISKSGIIEINRKMINFLMNIIFYDVKQLFMEKLTYEMFMILLNMLSSLRYKLKEEISFLLRNDMYVDISYDYLKNLYQKEKLLLKINDIILKEISSMNELEQQVIFYKKQNPFINFNQIAEKYHIPLHKIKKILYSFRRKVVAEVTKILDLAD